jgi:hypothetical protein
MMATGTNFDWLMTFGSAGEYHMPVTRLGKVCKSPGIEVWLSYPGRTRTKGVPR